MEELEQMREQLTILKQKLDQQEIVSDQLLRKITVERVKRLNRSIWLEGICALFVITIGNLVFDTQNCSIAFQVGTTILMVFCFGATWFSHRNVSKIEISQGSLIEVAKQVTRLRKFYQKWIYFAIPALAIWLGWYAWEVYQGIDKSNLKIWLPMLVGTVIGGIAGGLIGNHQRKKYINEMTTIINDIKE